MRKIEHGENEQVKKTAPHQIADREIRHPLPDRADVHAQLGQRGRTGQKKTAHQEPAPAGLFRDRVGGAGEEGAGEDDRRGGENKLRERGDHAGSSILASAPAAFRRSHFSNSTTP